MKGHRMTKTAPSPKNRKKFDLDLEYGHPTWDSGAITQVVDYSTGDGESTGESEGLAYKDGYVLVSNTADPSVCLLKASWAE